MTRKNETTSVQLTVEWDETAGMGRSASATVWRRDLDSLEAAEELFSAEKTRLAEHFERECTIGNGRAAFVGWRIELTLRQPGRGGALMAASCDLDGYEEAAGRKLSSVEKARISDRDLDLVDAEALGVEELERVDCDLLRPGEGTYCIGDGNYVREADYDAFWEQLPAWHRWAWMTADNGDFTRDELADMAVDELYGHYVDCPCAEVFWTEREDRGLSEVIAEIKDLHIGGNELALPVSPYGGPGTHRISMPGENPFFASDEAWADYWENAGVPPWYATVYDLLVTGVPEEVLNEKAESDVISAGFAAEGRRPSLQEAAEWATGWHAVGQWAKPENQGWGSWYRAAAREHGAGKFDMVAFGHLGGGVWGVASGTGLAVDPENETACILLKGKGLDFARASDEERVAACAKAAIDDRLCPWREVGGYDEALLAAHEEMGLPWLLDAEKGPEGCPSWDAQAPEAEHHVGLLDQHGEDEPER